MLSGADKPGLQEINLKLGQDLRRKKDYRQDYIPARIGDDGTVLPVEFHGSAHLSSLMSCHGFIIFPVGLLELPAGEDIRFLPLSFR